MAPECNCMFPHSRYFPAHLSHFFLSFPLKQTGADSGNGIKALSEALQMENRSHLCEVKSHLVTKFPSKKPLSTIS